MRALRFRVWTGAQMEYNVMVGKFGVFYVNPGSNFDGLDEKDSASLTPFNTKYPTTCPVMQYTGAVDKNGLEIYEGDIITHSHDGMTGVVVWNSAGYGFSIEDLKGEEFIADLNDYDWQPEVIGNIYENKELLNGR